MSINYKTFSAQTLPQEIHLLGNNLVGLELGVWYGVNMGHLLEDCPNISMLYGVDPYAPYQDWNRYIFNNEMESARASARSIQMRFARRCKLLECTSQAAVNQVGQLDFIFIDGDHSYEICYQDLNLWYDKVASGGLFAGHDFTLPGVNKALHQFRKEKNIKSSFKVIPNDVWFWIKD